MKNKLKSIAAIGCALLMISACAGTDGLPNPFSGSGEPLTMVPINHTDRPATSVFVDKSWAGNPYPKSGGGKAACCYPAMKNWDQPATVKILWGSTENPVTRDLILSQESKTYTAQFPPEGPNRSDPDHPETYLCVILRDFDKVDLAFSRSRGGCLQK